MGQDQKQPEQEKDYLPSIAVVITTVHEGVHTQGRKNAAERNQWGAIAGVDEEQQDSEIDFLKTSIYMREVELRTQTITAIDRHSTRV